MKKNKLLEIKNIDVNYCGIGKLENISIKVYEKEIVSVICDKNEQVLLSLAILGKTKRLKGDIFVNNSIIPTYPLGIFKQLKNKIYHYIKFVDLETRSLLVSQMKVIKSLIKTLKRNNYYKLKKENKLKIHKELLIEFAKYINDKELQLFIIENANKKEKFFYAKRNIIHYKQLLRINRLNTFEEWFKTLTLKKEQKENSKRIYRSIAKGESLDFIPSSALIYKRKIIKLLNEYKQKITIIKKQKDSIKKLSKKEKITLINSFFTFKKLKKNIKNYLKKQNLKSQKNHIFKFNFDKKNFIDMDNDSVYEGLKKKIDNLFFSFPQLKDYFFYKSICNEYKLLCKYNNSFLEFFNKTLKKYMLNNSYKAYRNLWDRSIKNLIKELGIEENILNEKVNKLSKGEQFDLLLLNSLLTNPKLLIITDNQEIDNTIRKQKLNKLLKIKNKYDLTFLFLTNDISTAMEISDFCYVINTKMIECGTTNEISTHPIHEYTRSLLFSQLPYSINKMGNYSRLFISEKQSIMYEPYKISKTHYIYEDPSLIEYWLTNTQQFEMDYIQKYSSNSIKTFEAKN